MSNNRYELTGVVVHIGDIEEFGNKGFYKRTLVVNDEADKYPQEIPFEAVKSAADSCTDFQLGDRVTVSFDLRGRFWEGGNKWFPSLNAWKVEKVGSKAAPKREAPDPAQQAFAADDTLDEEPPF